MYSHVIILTIFVSAFIAIVEMPNTFENVLAQQQLENSQQVSSSSSSSSEIDKTSVKEEEEEEDEEEEKARSSIDRIPNDGAPRR